LLIYGTPQVPEYEANKIRKALKESRRQGASVHVCWFDVEVAGPVTDDDLERLGDVLTAGDGIDAGGAVPGWPARVPAP